MRALIRGEVLALRYLGAVPTLVAWAAALVLCVTVPGAPLEVPGRVGVFAVVTNLIGLLPAVVAGSTVTRTGERERASVRGARAVGARWLVMTLGCVAVLGGVGAALDVPTLVRNAVLLTCVNVVMTLVVSVRVGWVVVVGFSMANWLLGIRFDGSPHGWALLMADAGSVPALAGAGAALGLSLLVVTRSWTRGSPRMP